MKAGVFLFILLLPGVSALHINEVMFNPLGSDNNREFVEVFLNDLILDNCSIADSTNTDELNILRRGENAYAVIVEEGFDPHIINQSNATFYSVGTTIGDNLNNNEDNISIWCNNTILANMSYDGSLANGDGYSLEWYNNSWKASLDENGTPGNNNSWEYYTPPQAPIVLNSTAFVPNSNQGNITIRFWLENMTGNETVTINGNVSYQDYNNTNNTNKTLSLTPPNYETNISIPFFTKPFCVVFNASNSSHNITYDEYVYCMNETINEPAEICSSFSLEILNTKIIETGTQIRFRPITNSTDFTFEYGIYDLFNNEYKAKRNTSNANSKSYTPRIDERIVVLRIHGKLYDSCIQNTSVDVIVLNHNYEEPQCQETTSTTSSTSSKTQETSTEKTTQLTYELIYPEIITNETFNNELIINNDGKKHNFTIYSYIYKGSTTYSGERESNSKQITLEAGEKKTITLTNVIEAENGDYKLKVKILKDNLKTARELTKEVSIQLNPIVEVKITKNATTTKKEINNTPINNISNLLTGMTVYESPQAKLKDYAGYGLIIIGALVAFLFFRKGKLL